MAKNRTYYLHTIDGRPAFYVHGMQICFANRYGKPAPLATSLGQIKREQRASVEWRRAQGYDHSAEEYGYRRVSVSRVRGRSDT